MRTPFRIPRVCIDREAGGIGTSLTREPVLSQYGSKSVSPLTGLLNEFSKLIIHIFLVPDESEHFAKSIQRL